MSVVYVLKTKVAQIRRHSEIVKGWKDENGKDQYEYKDKGWHVLFEGSLEWLRLGDEKPDLKVGDEVEIRIGKANVSDT